MRLRDHVVEALHAQPSPHAALAHHDETCNVILNILTLYLWAVPMSYSHRNRNIQPFVGPSHFKKIFAIHPYFVFQYRISSQFAPSSTPSNHRNFGCPTLLRPSGCESMSFFDCLHSPLYVSSPLQSRDLYWLDYGRLTKDV